MGRPSKDPVLATITTVPAADKYLKSTRGWGTEPPPPRDAAHRDVVQEDCIHNAKGKKVPLRDVLQGTGRALTDWEKDLQRSFPRTGSAT
jgi:hypothetical protein